MVVWDYFQCVISFYILSLTLILGFLVTMFVFGVISIEVWPTQLPVWAFALALIICGFPKKFS